MSITYVALVLPVSVDGITVQANDISIFGTRAFVAYNAAGEAFAGAVLIIDITDPISPSVLQSIKFSGRDIHGIYYDNQSDEVIFGGASNPDIYNYRSFIGKINPSSPDINQINDSIKSLPSYGLNSICEYNNSYYVSVGAKDGQLIQLDKNFNTISATDISDIRSVTSFSGGTVALAGTTDQKKSEPNYGRLILNSSTIVPIGSFDSPERKAKVVTIRKGNSDIAFMAVSKEGLKVAKIESKDSKDSKDSKGVVYSISKPEGKNSDTNSVTFDSNLLFEADGEYGFRIYTVDNGLIDKIPEKADPENVIVFAGEHKMTGELYQGQNYSANEIRYSAGNGKNPGVLFVACGVGGLNIYTVN